MRVAIGIMICKLVTKVCKLFGKNGSVFPGMIIYDYWDKKILNKIKYPKYVIAVTGSAGKSSSTRLIAHILSESGLDVVYNKDESNGILAAMTLVLNNCKLNGEFKRDVLLLECDERHLKYIFEENKMTHILITNITRDQPIRNGYGNLVFEDIVNVIGENTKLVINGDDVLVNTLKNKYKDVTTYGVDRTKNSYTKINLNAVDFQYCPICHRKLKYDFYHYGHIGSYKCEECGFSRNPLTYEAKNVDLKNKKFKFNGEWINLDKDALYAVYYTMGAIAMCKSLGISEEVIIKAINVDKMDAKRGKTYKLEDRDVVMLESKNENSASYYQSLSYIKNKPELKTIILGFEEVSKRYKYSDISWLYDIEFELLNEANVDKIFCIGKFRYDVATRLEYAGIDKNKMILVDNKDMLVDLIKEKSKGTIYTMVCISNTVSLKKLFEGENNENN